MPGGLPVKKGPWGVPGDPEVAERTCQEILDLLKECIWCKWDPAQLEEGLRQRFLGTRTYEMSVQAEFHDQMQVTYDHFGHFQDRQQELCKEALRVAGDAHHQVHAAAALLEGHIKRLSCPVTHGWSGS